MGEYAELQIQALFDRMEQDFESDNDDDKPVTCKHCGKKGLCWTPHPMRGYYLAEITYEKHVCRHVARVEDFADIS